MYVFHGLKEKKCTGACMLKIFPTTLHRNSTVVHMNINCTYYFGYFGYFFFTEKATGSAYMCNCG